MRRNMLKRLGCAVLAGIMVMGVTACSKKEVFDNIVRRSETYRGWHR